MSNVLLIANINCDRLLELDHDLQSGGRFYYLDGGRRLGGGGANTGIGLAWGGHNVALAAQVGSDNIGDWLLNQADEYKLDSQFIQRSGNNTDEILLIMTPDGERTIVRPQRYQFTLPEPPSWGQWDALYINSTANNCENWAESALEHSLVVAQLDKEKRPMPCHILITSVTEFCASTAAEAWQFAQKIGGNSLQYFIVTQGENGATLYHQSGTEHIAAIPAEVVDTTGAGDAFAAGLIHGLMLKQDILSAMKEATRWANFAVASRTSIPSLALKTYLSKA